MLKKVACLPFVIGIMAILPYASLLLSGDSVLKDSIYSDYASFQLPVREFVRQEFLEGRFPHWIPWLGCGIPLHAAQQVGLCYPLLSPLLLLMSAGAAIKISLFLHAILCYWGQYRVGRQLGISVSGAALSGLIATLSGFLCVHLVVGHVAIVFGYSLIPWLLSCVVEICQTPSIRGACRFAIVVGLMFLTGQPQVPYYALLFTGVWAAVSLAIGNGSSNRIRVALTFSIGLSLGIAIAAVQLLPAIDLVRDNAGLSGRGTPEYASGYSLHGLDLIRFFLPTLKGNPFVDIPEFMPPDFGHEKVCYMGLTFWCLAGVALFRKSSSRWPWGAAALILFGLVISLGDSTFLFAPLCRFIPGLTLFRCPGRCLAVVAILMALLAGRGYDALIEKSQPLRFWPTVRLLVILWLLGNGAAIVVDSALAGFDFLRWVEFAKTNLRTEFLATFGATALAVFVVSCGRRLPEKLRPTLIAAALLLDLGYFNIRCIQYESDPNYELTASTVATVAQERFIDGDTGFRADQVRYSRLVAAAIRAESRMIGTNEGGVLPASCEAIFDGVEKNPDVLLRLAACKVLVKKNGVHQPLSKESLPRVWFCPFEFTHYLQLPVDAIADEDVDAMLIAARETPVRILLDGTQQMTIEVDAKQNGTLVVADAWYPEWKASIDGRDCRIEHVWHCFRGVPLKAGHHTIEFRYVPARFWMGLWISIAAIIAVTAISASLLRKQSRPHESGACVKGKHREINGLPALPFARTLNDIARDGWNGSGRSVS